MSGPQCCDNSPTLNPAAGSGHVQKLAGLDSYVTGSSHSNRAVILVSDVFGYEAPNLRKLADKVAADGFYVVVPDFLYGDPYAPEKPIQAWLNDHGTDKSFEDAKSVVEALKGKGVSAIGAAGFCWGAKVVVQLAKPAFIKGAVMLHPSLVTVDDINAVEVPVAILGAEIDQHTPPALVKQFEEVLNTKPEIDHLVKIFPNVVHGWTMRYNVEDENAVKSANEAYADMIAWFTKHVK
ncbi:endo-1,3;1,4-beta-D-glucanase-like [Mercurialis annua]|uniref:endo-1,3;1,4-beta-D-glucanase-like n=1 Tax=Mercurialis annua TaxID=3986 RepID=UPI00215E4802|nr:endo-1,3;1,4-beta-D-glucanase-like [Mercurialis annua]